MHTFGLSACRLSVEQNHLDRNSFAHRTNRYRSVQDRSIQSFKGKVAVKERQADHDALGL